jgi:alanine dehydrogenase
LLDAKTIAVGYETVQLENGSLPLLAPMSEVAGRMATQIGAHYLERDWGGRGVLLGGAPGVQPGRVVVLGAGNVGWNAAWIAQGMEAEVTLLDKNLDRLRFVDQIHQGRIVTQASNRGAVERSVADADLVIGAVLVPGGRAPILVTDDMVRGMRRGAVIVDVAVDQGGCIETTHETTHADPTYVVHDVIHYAVGNVPASVPRTSTYALTNATLPYVVELASNGVRSAVEADAALARGVNTVGGHVTNAAVAEASIVFTATIAMQSSVPASVEPGLKPNQPKARMNVPSITIGMLCGAIGLIEPSLLYLPRRGPIIQPPMSAITPPCICTTDEPAKSTVP